MTKSKVKKPVLAKGAPGRTEVAAKPGRSTPKIKSAPLTPEQKLKLLRAEADQADKFADNLSSEVQKLWDLAGDTQYELEGYVNESGAKKLSAKQITSMQNKVKIALENVNKAIDLDKKTNKAYEHSRVLWDKYHDLEREIRMQKEEAKAKFCSNCGTSV